MAGVTFTSKGDFSKTLKFLNKLTNQAPVMAILNKYGKLGVDALRSATPVESGATAAAWDYEIEMGQGQARVIFTNSNLGDDWFPIALGLQYGHGTGTGGWVEGRDYINPAIQPVFEQLADALWKEVTAL